MNDGTRPEDIQWRRVRAVIEKEWAEVRKNKMILWTMALLPVLLVAMILGTDYFMIRLSASGTDMDEDEMPIPDALQHLPRIEAFVIQMNEQYMFYLLLIPATLPVYIAAHSIIGEKETKTLEPLLATPISTWELLVGKSVAATVPPVVLTWLSFAILLVGLKLVAPPTVFAYSVRAVWIVGMLLISPLLAFLSVLIGVIVSSRINDPRAAQQIAGIFVIPLIGLSLVVLAGLIFINVQMVLYASMVTLIVDLVVLYFAVKVFQRETILTRWK
ncbi:MAG: ABC transporter permease subunit [Planctomycetota bacterium]|jgi:ABC-2 type transport system permease protein